MFVYDKIEDERCEYAIMKNVHQIRYSTQMYWMPKKHYYVGNQN